ncbi:Rieske 2Fe-2S domain-containing protein [Mycolicibacterium brisbanense]|uniref:Ring-hydroxylating dioxygenase, large terminal subunit n=1 Tax=Mycolicibacterium brisbanense TaxID=146020 RepID=A0A100VYS0_9MYCO|nr:Rieske 2Fe-2S domain-containing protein [Mycolicibacterium brisbanense]MCV7158614.1 Rieske 2Fe-2S domain-containing protein [Mycolicibacterium brisbanense]GAS88462.1 Ring-hydroxylating dioxygenase, large terminal subunit [Mycolicibacterium brisbanense]
MKAATKPLHRLGVTAKGYPRNAWYALAATDEVADGPFGTRALERPVVLFRVSDGSVVALADRDAHRPYPLSRGRVDGDTIVSGYSGFAYDRNGTCVRVPTQAQVPYGAQVPSYPVREHDGLVWVWLGEPSLADRRPPEPTPWLSDPAWTTFGGQWETAAHIGLLLENFADITHVAVVDPVISPPALTTEVAPPLEVQLTETTVSFRRDWPPAPMPAWQADITGASATTAYPQREEGAFLSPGLWADRWDCHLPESEGGPQTFRFTHAITPVDAGTTRHIWRVSRNFAPGEAATEAMRPIFEGYYRRVQEILQTMQEVIDTDGYGDEVSVAADVAALQVRKIMRRLVADEGA